MSRGALIELVDRDEAQNMDEELVRMARSQTAVRLAIGEGFVALANGWQELGFSRFVDYVRERCQRSGRWGEDTRSLARRLMDLPHIRRALLRSEIGWCMAEVLARVATPEDEEELLEATRGMTVRQVERVLAERGASADEPEDGDRFGTLDVSVDMEEAWMLEATRPMVELLDGRGQPGAWLESMLAEAQCALSNIAPGADLTPEDVAQQQKAWLESIARGRARVDRREELAEAALPPMPEAPLEPVLEEVPDGPLAIDRRLVRELAPRLASCDLAFGRLLARFFRARGWRVLGFASETQYARERLGMSRSAVYARMTLANRAAHLGHVGDALHQGRIGYEAASLIARVATPDTEEAWVERATRRTHKHFEEEVRAAEQIARMMRLEDPPGPPSEQEIGIVQSLERDMKCGAYARRAFGVEWKDDAPARVDAAIAAAPESAPAVMARAAMGVQEALRAMILRARQAAGSLSAEEAEAACTGEAEPADALPTIDLEEDVLWPSRVASGAPIESVQTFGDATTVGVAAREPADPKVVQMFGDDATTVSNETAPSQPGDACGPAGEMVAVKDEERRALLRAFGKVNLRVRAREETIFHYRMLKAAYERAGLGGTFVRFMVVAFWSSWAEVLGRTNACEAILRRDGYECTCPVCGRPAAPGSHHLQYRSHGGGDEEGNLTSPCDWCHLDGEHGGRLKVSGEAPELVWLIGRTPIMEVRGRERRSLAA